MKVCTRCKIEKEDVDFRKRFDKRDQRAFLNSTCKKCDTEVAQIYYKKHKDDPGFKEKNRVRTKNYLEKNIEEVKNRRKLPEYIKNHNDWAKKRYPKIKDELKDKLKIRRQTPEYKRMMADYRKKNKEKIHEKEVVTKKKYHEKHKNNLTDEYVVRQIVSQKIATKQEAIENPDLIELKRVQILKKRIRIEILKKQRDGKKNG